MLQQVLPISKFAYSLQTQRESTPDTTRDQVGNESSSSGTSRHIKNKTHHYGSPIYHAVKEVSESHHYVFPVGQLFPSQRGSYIHCQPRENNRSRKKEWKNGPQKKEDMTKKLKVKI